MKHSPRVTIMIHRDDAVESRSLRIPVWVLRAGTIAGGALFVFIIVAAILYGPVTRTAARVPALNREIEALRAEVQQVRDLSAALEEVEARYQQVRTMLGGDVVPDRARVDRSYPTAPPILARAPVGASQYVTGPSQPRYWPLDAPGVITRGVAGEESGAESHRGLDVAVPRGTPIRAAGGGLVAQAGSDPEYGLFVLINHPDEYQSMYGHASRILVAPGDTVQPGQVIALSGSTGRSTAPHLHFEIRSAGRNVDPRSMVTQEGL
jgi:murein DD-endopeptidase MepM/ murein hydrolase activator NlpD